MNQDHFLIRWRRYFFTGLAIMLPAVVSFTVIFWLFFTVSRITDTLLIFIPRSVTHQDHGTGDLYWYWRLVALLVALLLTSVVGLLARNYLGRKMIEMTEEWLLRVPVLNKIYSTTKQVNEAFTSGNKNTFKTVVMVQFPRAGTYSVGFLTGGADAEIQGKLGRKAVSVFVPTTPNPTAGFLIIVPEDEVTKLDMSVADGIKFIISLGAINPEHPAALPDNRADKS